MRVFAKDVSGQKLDRGFESRPLRFSISHSPTMIRGGAGASRRGGAEGGGRLRRSCGHAVMRSCALFAFLSRRIGSSEPLFERGECGSVASGT